MNKIFFGINLFTDFEYIEAVKGYVTSKQGRGRMLVDQRGYVYQVNRADKRVEGKVFWQCPLRRKSVYKCTVGCVSRQDKIINITGNHNHPPSETNFKPLDHPDKSDPGSILNVELHPY